MELVEVTVYDARTVTGTLVDEPLGATNVSQGSKVTRPREDVEDLREPMGHGVGAAVRPKRGEGLGAIGRSEGIAVWAVALLSRS